MEKEKEQKKNKLFFIKEMRRFFLNLSFKKEIYLIIENLTALLNSGMSISESFDVIIEETQSKKLRKTLNAIIKDVDSGSSLTNALDKSHFFSNRMLSLIHLGELSGKLAENMEVLVLQNKKDANFRSQIKSSLIYGIVVFSLTIIIAFSTALFILPRLSEVFLSLGADLPLLTRILIAIGQFFNSFGYIVVPLFFVVFFIVTYFLFIYKKTKFIGHTILFHLPIAKNLTKEVEIARFGFLLGTMLKAGMPVIEACQTLPETTTFKNYQNFYIFLRESLNEGNSFKKSFSLYEESKILFPASVRQMIIAGEKSGNLEKSLMRIGEIHETKLDEISRNLPVLLEPVLLLIIGTGVALLALSIMLPIYKLSEVV